MQPGYVNAGYVTPAWDLSDESPSSTTWTNATEAAPSWTGATEASPAWTPATEAGTSWTEQ